MGTPRAVQKQIDDANAIQQSIIDNGKTKPETELSKVPAEQKTKASEAKAPGGTEQQLKAELEQVQNRYTSYKKMYDKEVHQFRSQMAAKDAELDKLKADVTALTKQVDDLKKLKEAPESNADDDTDIEAIKKDFGPDFVDAVGNLSRSQLMRQTATLIDRIDGLEQKLAGKQAQPGGGDTAGEPETKQVDNGFYARLTDLVPNWKQVNGMPAFSEFLDLPDSDGVRRQDSLADAQKQGDAIGVAKHFLEFADHSQPHRTGSEGDYLPDGSAGGLGDILSDDDEVVYQDELNEFYRLQSLGKLSPAEEAKAEAKIENAMRKNLIKERPRR